MRVTHRMITENAIQNMDDNLKKIQKLQEKISSGKAYQQASEEPRSAAAVLSLRSVLKTNQAYIESAQATGGWMAATETALSHLIEMGIRARSLVEQGVTETLNADERAVIAAEINLILEEAIKDGNTTHNGNHIFSGYQTTTAPFTAVDSDNDGLFEAVTYNGDTGAILRTLGPDYTITQNINGDAVLSPLYTALIKARDALNANDTAAIDVAFGELHTALENITIANSDNGARQKQLEALRAHYEQAQLELQDLISRHEDVNLAEAITTLRYQEIVYQTVLEVGHRAISTLNLFDILS